MFGEWRRVVCVRERDESRSTCRRCLKQGLEQAWMGFELSGITVQLSLTNMLYMLYMYMLCK